MKDFDTAINEAMSNASYMDVRELRALYYGRSNMYVSFTDNSKYDTTGQNRPDGIVAHQIDTVVGRKANTNLLYGRVFRIDKSAGRFIEDIKNHSNDSLKVDIEAIYALSYLKADDIDAAVAEVMGNSRIHRPFDRLWQITKTLSKKDNKKWAKIFLDIGYIGFADQTGSGVLTKKKDPVALLIDMDAKTDFDIVPVQKYRTDPRARIRDDVNKQVRLMSTARNRVAKQQTPVFRKDKKKKSVLDDFKELIKVIGALQ